MLKNTQVKILRADNGVVAVNLCREDSSIDLVLMDIRYIDFLAKPILKNDLLRLRPGLHVSGQ